jgi:hypothetical protein
MADGRLRPISAINARRTRERLEPCDRGDRDGVVWVAWDGYAGGNYNIYLRAVGTDDLGIAHGNRVDALPRPSIVDVDNGIGSDRLG